MSIIKWTRKSIQPYTYLKKKKSNNDNNNVESNSIDWKFNCVEGVREKEPLSNTN